MVTRTKFLGSSGAILTVVSLLFPWVEASLPARGYEAGPNVAWPLIAVILMLTAVALLGLLVGEATSFLRLVTWSVGWAIFSLDVVMWALMEQVTSALRLLRLVRHVGVDLVAGPGLQVSTLGAALLASAGAIDLLSTKPGSRSR